MNVVATLLLVLFLAPSAFATDRYYPDVHVSSLSGRYKVDATSPDNEKDGRHAFQDEFTYRFVDTKTGKLIWKREQEMTVVKSDDGSTEKYPDEGSPVDIFISDNGTTVVYTGYGELIVVSPTGRDVREIDFIKDALTKSEYKKYVHRTSAGPMWEGLSTWYFLGHDSKEYFVVRPWWGRRVFVNVADGKLIQAQKWLESEATKSEKQLVMKSLKSKTETDEDRFEKLRAVYLAGALEIKDAIPFVKDAEKSTYIGSSTSGGLSAFTEFENEVDPHRYETFTMRQVAQLSLRRLGISPSHLPCHSFKLTKSGVSNPYDLEARKGDRHDSIDDLKVGMSAKKILDLIGSPDFISYHTWSYDMDGDKPFTLNLQMDAKNVTKIEREKPLWKSGLLRDEALAN